jgi:hypothetical protein
MLLDFSVDWQWIIGGTDVSPHVETWELAREQPDMSTPAWWRGRLVLRPVVGRNLSLDPLTNSLWSQGTSCSLTVGGSLVFTGSILLAYYDDWSTDPKLELEVGDVLAAKNHRQVIPFGEYNAWSLLRALRIPGVAPAGDAVEISTDLTSPVKVVQELTWVTWLKRRGLPATLFTRPDGQVDYVSPQAEISLTRTLEQVADFTRQRPALEIPGSVVASASLTYYVQPPTPVNEDASDEETVLVSRENDVIKVSYLDSFGRITKEEAYRNGVLDGFVKYRYHVDRNWYEIIKEIFIRVPDPYQPYISRYPVFEYTREIGKEFAWERISVGDSDVSVYRQVVAQKQVFIYWPDWRFFPVLESRWSFLAYLIEEYSILGRAIPRGVSLLYNLVADTYTLLRMVTRAKGTTQDTDTLFEAITLLPTVSEIILNQQLQFPGWVKQFWDPPKIERITDTLSEEMKVVGFTGPPVYLTVPWLSVTVDEQLSSKGFQQKISNLRQNIQYALQSAATWMAFEIAGRAFARRIKMPPPAEWLANPRPWTLARIGDEVLWLVGETLRGTIQGVEFEATGILAGRPSTIPPGEFPPGTIPSFVPLITVVPTRFPQVGIGCVMQAGEAVFIPGDPWLGMAVEIEYSVSVPVDTSAIVGIGVGELTEAWLGMASDATHEIEGNEDDEDDSGSETEGLTLEAENGEISGGAAVIVYDTDASSCYAVEAENSYFTVDLSVDSTSLDWERPLRIRVIYKAEDEGEIYVYTIRGEEFPDVGYWTVSATTGYVSMDLIIPAEAEPFDGIRVEVNEYPGKIRIDAIQLAPATGDWPPLNPCSN